MKNKKKRRLKRKVIYFICGVFLFIFILFGSLIYYFSSSVSDDSTNISVVIPSGYGIGDIASLLKEKDLIHNREFFILYMKINNIDNIYAASYELNKSMNIKEIANTLKSGGENSNMVSITFKEGINMREVARLISSNTNNSYDDVMSKLSDSTYLDSLIENYSFIGEEVKNNNIYYSLEGYLFPDTYYVNKDDSVEDIFKVMLDEMGKFLSSYENKINSSKFSIHEILTISSMVQSEGVNSDDFKNIASVFINRINSGMSLGSCVTSYYGVKKDMDEELLQSDISAKNAYNTRGDNAVLVPVGPISLPSSSAILAVISPIDTDYYYFVSDKNNKLYFTKTYSEHLNIQQKLKNEGLWLEW